MQPDLVCDGSIIDHHNHKDSPAITSVDNQIQNSVNHSDDTLSKPGDSSPYDSNSANRIKDPGPDQDGSIDEDDVEELPPHLDTFDLNYSADESGYAAPANGYQDLKDGSKQLMNKQNHVIKKSRETERTRCLAQGLPADNLESQRPRKMMRAQNLAKKQAYGEEQSDTDSSLGDESRSTPWVFEDEAATSFTNCTKGEKQVSNDDDLGITEDDVEDLPIRCDILHLRYPADESGYAAPAKGYQEWQDRIKEKRDRTRIMGKAQDTEMRQQRLDQILLAEDSEDRQDRKYASARGQAEKQMLSEDASDTDTSLSADEFGSDPWVLKEPNGPQLSGDRRVKNYPRTHPDPVPETMDASENISLEDQEIQEKVARLGLPKYRVFSKPYPRDFIPSSEFERMTREKRRAKGIPTPPHLPSAPRSLFDWCIGDGPSVIGLQETETDNILINEYEADTGESSPVKSHDSLDRVISPDLQPTVEPDEDEPIFASQQGQDTEGANEKEAVTAPQRTENQDENQEVTHSEVPAANTLYHSSRTSAEMPMNTSGEPGSPRYRKPSMDVSTDDELLMYDKLHGTNICVEPMNFDDPDVVLMSEFDFMELEERRCMGGPTPPCCALSPSENAPTETSSDDFYERVKRPRYPCAGQKWYVNP